MQDLTNQIALARSFLFVPGNRPERFGKALASGADMVIVDLEDAVSPDDKPAARGALQQTWAGFSEPERGRLLVRINAADTPWHAEDLNLLHELSHASVVLPKAESAAQLHTLGHILGPDCVLMPLIESARGIANVNEIAAAPQVARLALGHIDLQADLGMQCDATETELLPARFSLVLASRLAQIAPPVDGVTVRTDDAAQMHADTLRSKRMGFSARLCIHPNQVGQAHAGFAPSADELTWAQRVVAADQASNGGAVKLDGRMIDRPVVLLAQRTLAAAR
jgi:citrate lyase subunit beta/citryl-CoA lyase